MATGTPEIIIVPAVPTAEALAAAMSTPQAQAAMITDIYNDLQNTAQSLSDHVSSSGNTHDMVDQLLQAQSAGQVAISANNFPSRCKTHGTSSIRHTHA